MALGHLPAVFALPAGLGDITIGLAAPTVARRLTSRGDHQRAVRFHLLGILDLVATVAVPTALALHVVALGQLHTTTRPQEDRAEDPLPAGGRPRWGPPTQPAFDQHQLTGA